MAEIASEADLWAPGHVYKLGALATIPWGVTLCIAVCLYQYPTHPVMAGALVSLAAVGFFTGIASICAWIWLYKEYRERKRNIPRWDLERDIESLERDLGIGLGEDWWRPDGVLAVSD